MPRTTIPEKVEEPVEAPPAPELVVADEPYAKLVAALAAAQGEFPPIAKGKTASVRMSEAKGGGSYSYSYADLADVLAAVRPVLARYGLAVVQRTKREANGNVVLVTELAHVGGAVIVSELDLEGKAAASPQQFGATLTYLRRYELVTLLGIAAEEDTDAQHVDTTPQSNRAPAWAAPANARGLEDLAVVLSRLMGGHRPTADAFVEQAAAAFGGAIPATFANAVASLPKWREAGLKAKAHAEAAAAAGAQDKAAERPDPPSPEPAPQEAPAELHRDAPLNPDELAEEPPPDEVEEARAAAEAAGITVDDVEAGEPERADAGTVDPPDVELLDGRTMRLNVTGLDRAGELRGDGIDGEVATRARRALRAAGCTCEDPLKADGDDDACPVKGHGIPF